MIAAALSISCSDNLFGVRHGGTAYLAFAPRFTRENAAIYKDLKDFNLQVNALRVVLVKPAADTLKDTTVTIAPTDTVIIVELKVEIDQPEVLDRKSVV